MPEETNIEKKKKSASKKENLRKQKRLIKGASMKTNKYIEKDENERNQISADKISKHQNENHSKTMKMDESRKC
jgi:hypothetical protein